MERMGWAIYSTELLRMIPGVELTLLDSNCCGISGTYGFKKENYKRSQAIGAPLFKQIEELKPEESHLHHRRGTRCGGDATSQQGIKVAL